MQKLNPAKLTVVLPCYNEEAAIPKVLCQLLEQRQEWQNRSDLGDIEIIVVNDGSTDGSLKALEPFSQSIRLISYNKNKGYGYALKKGFEQATGEYLSFYDLDETCQAHNLQDLLLELQKNSADVALGNRINEQTKMPLHRQVGNLTYRYLGNTLLSQKTSDYCTGFRMFHNSLKDLFIQTLPNDLNFSLAMTVVCRRLNLKLLELEIEYKDRKGESKLNSITHGLQFLSTLIYYGISPKYKSQNLKHFL